MKSIIIEDEQIAAQNLKRLLAEIAPETEVAAILQTVEETVEYFAAFDHGEQPASTYPDLVFMDIHLADGLAFHVFDSVTIKCPIIFTTAYDQYALDAFKVNSIDYLLKPISHDDLERAIAKVRDLVRRSTGSQGAQPQSLTPETIAAVMDMMQRRKYKSHFLMPVRDKLVPLPVSEIAYIYLDEKITRVVTLGGQSFPLDKPLDAVYALLDPARFFRANRQYIIAHSAVKDISVWPLSKLNITLTVPTPEKIIVSRARTAEFKDWYTA